MHCSVEAWLMYPLSCGEGEGEGEGEGYFGNETSLKNIRV